MNKSTTEFNMSIDDSLIISSGLCNVLNEIFDYQTEQQLNTTIEQFNELNDNKIEEIENKQNEVQLQEDSKSYEKINKEIEKEATVASDRIIVNEINVQIKNDHQQNVLNNSTQLNKISTNQTMCPTKDQLKASSSNEQSKTMDESLHETTDNHLNNIDHQTDIDQQNKIDVQNDIDDLNDNNKIDHQIKVEISIKTTENDENKIDISLNSNENDKVDISIKSIDKIDISIKSIDNDHDKINTSIKSNEMSVDESLVLNDIRNIFEISTSSSNASEFIISKPLKKIDTPNRQKKDSETEMSFVDANDSLGLKEIKIVNNSTDCLDNSPYLKSLPPPSKPAVFKLSRKRLNCETESPIKKSGLSSNLFKSQFTNTPLISSHKKWRSATYNPMTSSPKKMELGSPLKTIDSNIICANVNPIINSTLDSLLMTNLNMMYQKSEQLPNLMGDYSNTYALPLMNGRHKDLKTISPETLVNLMDGKYESISCFTIVDSRYPYEFDGGHIDGAKNIFHKEEVNRYFFGTDKPTLITGKNLIISTIDKNIKQSSSYSMQRSSMINNSINSKNSNSKRLSSISENNENSQPTAANKINKKDSNANELDKSNSKTQLKRHAIIFHCEFSSERGPTMYRHLRKIDRELNENTYPNLYYPEIYLLHGGYKMFFEKFKDHCYPQTYLPMDSSDHKQDLMKFKKKSKTWRT